MPKHWKILKAAKRSYDKNTAQMARYFCHDKFPLKTCISNAASHFIAKWRNKEKKDEQ